MALVAKHAEATPTARGTGSRDVGDGRQRSAEATAPARRAIRRHGRPARPRDKPRSRARRAHQDRRRGCGGRTTPPAGDRRTPSPTAESPPQRPGRQLRPTARRQIRSAACGRLPGAAPQAAYRGRAPDRRRPGGGRRIGRARHESAARSSSTPRRTCSPRRPRPGWSPRWSTSSRPAGFPAVALTGGGVGIKVLAHLNASPAGTPSTGAGSRSSGATSVSFPATTRSGTRSRPGTGAARPRPDRPGQGACDGASDGEFGDDVDAAAAAYAEIIDGRRRSRPGDARHGRRGTRGVDLPGVARGLRHPAGGRGAELPEAAADPGVADPADDPRATEVWIITAAASKAGAVATRARRRRARSTLPAAGATAAPERCGCWTGGSASATAGGSGESETMATPAA